MGKQQPVFGKIRNNQFKDEMIAWWHILFCILLAQQPGPKVVARCGVAKAQIAAAKCQSRYYPPQGEADSICGVRFGAVFYVRKAHADPGTSKLHMSLPTFDPSS